MIAASQIFVRCRAGADNSREQALAARLQLPALDDTDSETDAFAGYLQFEKAGLTLHLNSVKVSGGLRIDFNNPQLQRRSDDHLRQQNICKAVGLKGQPLQVLDAMAGLGKDAWLLACAGAQVEMLERCPVIFSLLDDAFVRGQSRAVLRERMRLREADFLDVANELAPVDVVYLDPMFPPSNKQARARKDMHLLQTVLGESKCDEQAVFNAARSLARRRVVVKRAKLSPHFAGQKPDTTCKGSANRFDVYLNHAAVSDHA